MNESNNHYGKKLIIVFFNKSPMGNAFIFFFSWEPTNLLINDLFLQDWAHLLYSPAFSGA